MLTSNLSFPIFEEKVIVDVRWVGGVWVDVSVGDVGGVPLTLTYWITLLKLLLMWGG